MKKYEELYNHAKYVFDEEVSRFGRVEDKAARFITVVTSLLAVYALTGRQLFGELIPAENYIEIFLIVLAALVLFGLLASWGLAFHAMYIQGMKKPSLNDKLLSFYNDNELINIYYGMSKKFSESLVHNRAINDLKAQSIKRSFWCIVATVIFFALFIIVSAVNENSKKTQSVKAAVILKKGGVVKSSTSTDTISNLKEEIIMSENDNGNDTQPTTPAPPVPQTTERPDLDIVAPEFDIVTESFDPSKLPTGKESKE